MIWFIIFLLGIPCLVLAMGAWAVWLGIASVQALLTCIEKSLVNFSDGHAILGTLYLVPAGLFICALGEGIYLACSFVMAVMK